MSSRKPALALVLLATLPVLAGEEAPGKGAKALFIDSTSGAVVATSGAAKEKGSSSSASVKKNSKPSESPWTAPQRAPAGLMYYVELVRPSGEVLRVNTANRVFKSGERIRLHFMSNQNGKIYLVQKEKDGSTRMLYPDPRVNGGDNRLEANVDTILPSPKAFLRFDDQPGEERIIVLLQVDDPSQAPGTMMASREMTADKAVAQASLITKQSGSKSLYVEVDEKSTAPATYVVSPAATSGAASPSDALQAGAVAVEVVLQHQ